LALVAPPPTHLVYFANFDHGCGLIVQLFGTLRYGAPLSESITLVEPVIWTFDPIAGTASRTDLAQAHCGPAVDRVSLTGFVIAGTTSTARAGRHPRAHPYSLRSA
jgi:hypothetical protein